MTANRSEALNRDPCPIQIDITEVLCCLGTYAESETGGSDLVEWYAAEFRWQPYRSANLIATPGHAGLVRTHVRAHDVVGDLSDGAGEAAYQPFLLAEIHLGIGEDYGLASAVRNPLRTASSLSESTSRLSL